MKRLEPLAPVPEEPFVTPEPVVVEPVVAMEPVVSKRRNNSLRGCGDRGVGRMACEFSSKRMFLHKVVGCFRNRKKLTKKDAKKLPKEVNVVFLPSVSYHEKANGKTVAFPWGLLSQGPQRSWRQSYALHAFRLKDAGRFSDDQEFP